MSLIPPMPETSLTAAEIAAVTRDEVIAYAVFHRLYATLAPDRMASALMLADPTAITQALAEVHQHAYDDGYRAGVAEGAAVDQDHRKAVQVAAAVPSKEELKARRGEI